MRRHLSLLAATTAVLMSAVAASAQPVYIFDEAPSLEVLRSIVIPEVHGGQSRSIVMMQQGAATPSPVQSVVSTTIMESPAPAQPIATPVAPERHVVRHATPVSAPVAPRPAQVASASGQPPSDQAPEPGVIGFRINFAFDSAAVPTSGQDFIDRVAELMKETPELRLRIEGHTDATGTPDYNLELSKRRALAVGEYLVDHGVAPDRLELAGKGMSEPLTEDGSDPRNRRVQFVRVN